MADGQVPRLARPWVILVGAAGAGCFAWALISAADTLTSRGVCLAALLYIVALFRRVLSTNLTLDGVSQSTLTGDHVTMRWSEVRQVKYGQRGTIILEGDNGRIAISTRLYWDPAAAQVWIAGRLEHLEPSSGRRLTRA